MSTRAAPKAVGADPVAEHVWHSDVRIRWPGWGQRQSCCGSVAEDVCLRRWERYGCAAKEENEEE